MTDQAAWKKREIEILQLLAEGLSNKEIGTRLHLSAETIRWYNRQIFARLAVGNRQQAVNRAGELGLLRPAGPETPPSTTPKAIPLAPVRYAANGAVHIAYQVLGSGPIDLLFFHGFLSHLELAWQNPEFAAFFNQLSQFARVILFDKRGVGLSDRTIGAPSLENSIEDACCVLDAVGSRRCFVMGTSEGGAAAALLASTYPERVAGLILYAATPKVVRTDGEPGWAIPPDHYARQIELIGASWGGPWALGQFAPSRAADSQFADWWAMILRAASSPASVRAVMEIVGDIDIRPLLPQIRTRTLVMHKTGDQITRMAAGRYLAQQLPNATWLELPGADHIYFVDGAQILAAVAEFCQAGEESTVAVDSWLAIALFVASAGLPDLASVRATLRRAAPRQVEAIDSGMVALFASPSRAIDCARALQNQFGANGLRCSLHVGAAHVGQAGMGLPVVTAARAAAAAAHAGEIVVTGTLRDILAGSGWRFGNRPDSPSALMPLYTLET